MRLLSGKDRSLKRPTELTLTFLHCGEALTVRLRPAKSVIQNVEIADHRQDECMVKSDMVGDLTLKKRQDRAAHDSHVQHAGAIAGQWTELRDSEAKDRGEHDGVEQADSENCPHRGVPAKQH